MRRKKANDMNNMEIKQGDKVRVSKDAPLLYTEGRIDWEAAESTVGRIDGDAAEIDYIKEDDDELYSIVIPTKYLIKVDAEAKEPAAPTIKVGDRVCCYNVLHLKGSKKEDYMGIVTSITDKGIMVKFDDGSTVLGVRESDLELVQPTEQTEASADVLGEFTPIPRFYNPIIGFKQAYWQEYEADLAKEVAVKSMEKSYGCDPERIAEYAVSVAKAVVEGLKRK